MTRFQLLSFAVLLTSSANATIIYQWAGTSPTSAFHCGGAESCFEWTYVAQLASDQRIDVAEDKRSLGVLYDFVGFRGAFSTPLVGGIALQTIPELSTEPPGLGSQRDRSDLMNIRTEITGGYTPATLTDIFSVTVYSIAGEIGTEMDTYGQSAMKLAGWTQGNSGFVEGPIWVKNTPFGLSNFRSAYSGVRKDSEYVPEPGSAWLFAGALAYLALRLSQTVRRN